MKVPVLDSLPPRRRKLILWCLGLLLFYTVAGFLILPPIVRAVAVKQLAKQLDREVSIRRVKLNPFTLSCTVRGLLIKDKDGEPFVSFDEAYVNVQLSSLFGHPWVVKEVSTVNPFIRLQLNRDRTFNFSDLLEKFTTNAPAETPSRPLALRVGLVRITGASAAYADLTPRTPFKRVVGPLDLNLTDFRTESDSRSRFSLVGTTDAGARFSWQGNFSLDPLGSSGGLSVENVVLPRFAPLYQDLTSFQIKDGAVDVRADYRFALSVTNLVAAVSNASFALHSFKLAEPGQERNIVDVPEFAVHNANIDAVARQAEIGAITVDGASLALRRDKDSGINVIELTKPPATAGEAPGSVLLVQQAITNVIALFLSSTNAWSGLVHDVSATNCALHVEDFLNTRPVQLDIDHVALSVKHFSNVPGARVTLGVSAQWDTNGTVRVDGEGTLSPPEIDLQLALNELELRPLGPYLEPIADILILGSKLSVDGRARMHMTDSGLPEMTFVGDARLNDLAVVDGMFQQELLDLGSLRISGIEANLSPPTAAIREIAIDDVIARVIIETNRTINLRSVLRLTGTNAPAPTSTAETTPAKKKAAKRPLFEALQKAMTATNATGSVPLPNVSIGTVVISNVQMRYTDHSLSPSVNMTVGQIGGTITGLSSEELRHADVNLHASVNNTAPVEITGTINPFTENRTNELKITAVSVDLTPGSPYVGKFAGYRLARGKLDMDMAYHLQGKQIKSENLIVLDQFTFGEKVDSPDATKLPVRLAIAILKDRDGKIHLDVPIEGSLDDPEFRLGKVIAHAIGNVITKIATSPFAALGALLGGKGEEVAYQDFDAGSFALLPAGKEKLDSLLKALYERPALQLDIEGSVDPDADLEGLKRAALEKEIRQREWMSLRKSERETTTPEQVTPAPENHLHWLKQLYSEAVVKGQINPSGGTNQSGNASGRSPATGASSAGGTGRPASTEPEKGATALMQGINLPALPAASSSGGGTRQPTQRDPLSEAIVQALLPTVTVGDSDFQALAAGRAKAVRDYLLQSGKVEAERVSVVEIQPGAVKSQGSRAYLQLK